MITQRLQQLSLKRKEFVLRVDDLELHRGRTYAVLGPNGCGKSSLLDILGLLAVPDHGNVVVKEEPVDYSSRRALTTARCGIAYLMQDPYLFNTTVLRNVMLPLKLRHMTPDSILARASEILEMLGLDSLADRNVRELSGGEAQRTALARTLAIDADLVLLDEPTANVDRANIARVESAILKLASEHSATVVVTTHSETQAARISEFLVRVDDGRITEIEENPARIFDQ